MSLPVAAQDYSKIELFGGYQYTHLSGSLSPVGTANGWDGSFTYNFNPTFGLTGDFNGAYQTLSGSLVGASGSFPFHVYSYSGGPVVTFNSGGKLAPFVHLLIGGAHLTGSGSASGVTVSVSDNGITVMLGGGVDLKISKSFSLRLVQADWVDYHFDSQASLGIGSSNSAGTFKIATGIVFTH
jgi:hypothetical protein